VTGDSATFGLRIAPVRLPRIQRLSSAFTPKFPVRLAGVNRKTLLADRSRPPTRRTIGNIGGTDQLVRWIAEELGKDTYLNLMAQYRPEHKAFDHPAIARRLTREEWKQAVAWTIEAGLTNVRT